MLVHVYGKVDSPSYSNRVLCQVPNFLFFFNFFFLFFDSLPIEENMNDLALPLISACDSCGFRLIKETSLINTF